MYSEKDSFCFDCANFDTYSLFKAECTSNGSIHYVNWTAESQWDRKPNTNNIKLIKIVLKDLNNDPLIRSLDLNLAGISSEYKFSISMSAKVKVVSVKYEEKSSIDIKIDTNSIPPGQLQVSIKS